MSVLCTYSNEALRIVIFIIFFRSSFPGNHFVMDLVSFVAEVEVHELITIRLKYYSYQNYYLMRIIISKTGTKFLHRHRRRRRKSRSVSLGLRNR